MTEYTEVEKGILVARCMQAGHTMIFEMPEELTSVAKQELGENYTTLRMCEWFADNMPETLHVIITHHMPIPVRPVRPR